MRIPANARRIAIDPVEDPRGPFGWGKRVGPQKFMLMEVIGEEGAVFGRRPVGSRTEIEGRREEFDVVRTLRADMSGRRQKWGRRRNDGQGRRRAAKPCRRIESEDRVPELSERLRRPDPAQCAKQGRQLRNDPEIVAQFDSLRSSRITSARA